MQDFEDFLLDYLLWTRWQDDSCSHTLTYTIDSRRAGTPLLTEWLGTREKMGYTSCKDDLKAYSLSILILFDWTYITFCAAVRFCKIKQCHINFGELNCLCSGTAFYCMVYKLNSNATLPPATPPNLYVIIRIQERGLHLLISAHWTYSKQEYYLIFPFLAKENFIRIVLGQRGMIETFEWNCSTTNLKKTLTVEFCSRSCTA